MIDYGKKVRKINRNYGLDLYRVICISLIVIGHMQSESFICKITPEPTADYFFQLVFGNAERLSINGFIMISAWFLCDSKFSYLRLAKCWLMVFITNTIVTVLTCANGVPTVKPIYVIQALLPILGRPQWYMSIYMLLLCTHPSLNRLIHGKGMQNNHRNLILMGFLLIVVFDSLLFVPNSFTLPLFSEYIWFIYLYLLVSYIKLYPNSLVNKMNKKVWITISILSYSIIVWLNLLSDVTEIPVMQYVSEHFTSHYETIFAFLCSLGLFMLLKDSDRKIPKICTIIAKYTGYIYIIHTVPVLWRNPEFNIWENVFKVEYWYSTGRLIPAMIVITIIVISVGCFFGFIANIFINSICDADFFHIKGDGE